MRGAFIGPLGQLVEIAHYKRSIGAAYDRETSFKTTLGGGRFAFSSPNLGLRTWDVSAPMLAPSQFGPFEGLLLSSDGPFWWVDPLAQHTNVLTPRATLFQVGRSGGTVSGSFTGADGVVLPASLVATSGTVYFGDGTPVIPGVKVTASVYATAGTRLLLAFRDVVGGTVGSVLDTATVDRGRLSITEVAPAGAATVRISAVTSSGPGTVAGPALTWTDRVTPWGLGSGAAQAVAHDLSDDIVLASSGQQLKNLSFTVTEVGSGA